MGLRFHNTLTRAVEPFTPVRAGEVGLYTCGPTVYDYAHIGNFRTYLWEDLLRRHLELRGHKVTQVMNLTDVDDKTIAGALKTGRALDDHTRTYIDAFFEDLDALGIQRAALYPRATRHIPEMTALMERLRDGGHLYESKGSIYFRIDTFASYGRLSGLDPDSAAAGQARIDADEYDKDNPRDFAVWKMRKGEEPFWESPFGAGRPGWHLECSAMSIKYLGETFDIHTGGVDNIFPHHENEIAQSEAATGKPFVRTWLHAAHLIVDGEKMSKSKGNFFTLRDLMARGHRPRPIRYLLLSAHYRKQLNFTFEGLGQAEASLCRLDDLSDRLGRTQLGAGASDLSERAGRAREEMLEALDNDLNTAAALAPLFDLVRDANTALDAGTARADDAPAVRGTLDVFEQAFGIRLGPEGCLDAEVEALIEKRQAARAA
ncbi:MAG TPA: cysteine--tRNA ligase, partial [Candidatus Polarisedimenticolia bacterium]|nr:cysteine--tRNA ligase [Candidatus Polarisedimenticolia bacterium]